MCVCVLQPGVVLLGHADDEEETGEDVRHDAHAHERFDELQEGGVHPRGPVQQSLHSFRGTRAFPLNAFERRKHARRRVSKKRDSPRAL